MLVFVVEWNVLLLLLSSFYCGLTDFPTPFTIGGYNCTTEILTCQQMNAVVAAASLSDNRKGFPKTVPNCRLLSVFYLFFFVLAIC